MTVTSETPHPCGRRILLSILAGGLSFLISAGALIEVLAPYMWPAPLVALPVAVVAGVTALGGVYIGLSCRIEQRRDGDLSEQIRRRLRGSLGAFGGFVLGGGLACVTVLWSAGGIAAATFTAIPVGIAGAATGGFMPIRSGGGS
jgi:hypothetical protein